MRLRNENAMLKATNQQYIEVIKQATEQLKRKDYKLLLIGSLIRKEKKNA